MKGDFSRSTFRPDRPYSSVRMQQGRVLLDGEWNEQADITDYQRRRAIADIIGGCCIPESQAGSFEVSVSGGELRVEGGRAWVHGILAERADEQTLAVPAPAGHYVVSLEVFERHVTAIEDPEIREVALGGPDTATRTATVVRAAIAPVDGTPSCADLHGFVPPGETTGELTASTGAQPAETPCVVPTAAGYARLENQLYRVEIQRGGVIGDPTPPAFKWSRDNGSIAAEWLKVDGDEIVISDAGRDDVLGFLENRWVELGHDELDLSGEAGPIVEVIARRTDSDGHFRLEFDAHGQAIPDPTTVKHPKVRRWDQDDGVEPATGAVPILAANTAIAIEGGIEIQFSPGAYRAGDYWLIPARTFSGASTGDILWPRDAGGNSLPQPPHGVARFFCRLAIVSVTAGPTVQVVEDCRRTFPSLCGLEGRSSGCCTVTVGSPGGEVATIADALARLPAAGGEICVLPGTYRERVILDGRHDVTIHGCGRRTLIVAPDASPAFSLEDVENIIIGSLSIEALQGFAISMDDARDVTVEGVAITVRDRSAIVATDAQALKLLDSNVVAVLRTSGLPFTPRPVAVFLAGTGLCVERNRIQAVMSESVETMQSGGLQVGGGSQRVLIARNEIDGGFGPGLLLGSVSFRPGGPNFGALFDSFVSRRESDPAAAARSTTLDDAVAHFAELRRQPGGTSIIEDPELGFLAAPPFGLDVVSDGDLTDVRILGNEIRNMGGSGITAAHFFVLEDGEGDFISVDGLGIVDNVIEDCLRVRQQPVTAAMAENSARGGITLADVGDLLIRDNTIDRNGGRFRTPACGVFVLHSRGLEIHRNRIRHNGVTPPVEPGSALDRRGGIVTAYADVPTREVLLTPNADTPRHRQDGTPAVRIHDNVVIAPEGRAIEAIALGAVSVQGNQLTTLGADFRNTSATSPLGLVIPEGSPLVAFTNAFSGAVVLIFDLGVSPELSLQIAGFAGLNLNDTLPHPDTDPLADRPVLAGGNIQFVDNQVVLDATGSETTFALSSITLLGVDDNVLSGCQSDCDLVTDFVGTNVLVFGFSVRVTSNRFKEGLNNALYSAMTLGYLNWTTDNHGTHCFVRVGKQPPPLPGENMVLRQLLFGEDECNRALKLEQTFHTAIFGP